MKLLYLAIIIFLMPSAYPVLDQNDTWKHIKQSTYSFSYPKKWKIQFENDSNKGFVLKIAKRKYSPEICLEVQHYPKGLINRLQIHYGDYESFPKGPVHSTQLDTLNTEYVRIEIIDKLWKRIEVNQILSNDGNYIEAIHEMKIDNKMYKRIWRVYEKEDSRYYLSFMVPKKEWANYESDVVKIFDSFKLN